MKKRSLLLMFFIGIHPIPSQPMGKYSTKFGAYSKMLFSKFKPYGQKSLNSLLKTDKKSSAFIAKNKGKILLTTLATGATTLPGYIAYQEQDALLNLAINKYPDTFDKIIEKFPQIAPLAVPLITSENQEKLNETTRKTLYAAAQEKYKNMSPINLYIEYKNVFALLQEKLKQEAYDKKTIANLTQSEFHVLFGINMSRNESGQSSPYYLDKNTTPTSLKEILKNGFYKTLNSEYSNKKRIREVFLKLHNQERIEHDKGNFTFVHAQNWDWQLRADLFKEIWKVAYDENIDKDYQFLRYFPKGTYPINKEKREDILDNEEFNLSLIPVDGQYKYQNKDYLIFLNAALFGNSMHPGSCSTSYFINNDDQSLITNQGSIAKKYPTETLFKKFDLGDLYKKYASEINTLEKLHKEASQTGNILLLTFTPDQLKKFTYSATGGGNRKYYHVEEESNYFLRNSAILRGIRNFFFNPKTKTSDTDKVLEQLKNNPWESNRQNIDNIEFCAVLSNEKGGLLDPDNGPTIKAFNAADPVKLKKYETARDVFFKKIAQEIKEALKKKSKE